MKDYKRAIDMVRQHVKTLADAGMKGKWKMVPDALSKELMLAKETNEIK